MLERPVHSGVYGGAVGDALTALCRALATLHDDNGEVAIARAGARHLRRPRRRRGHVPLGRPPARRGRADRQRHRARPRSGCKPAVAVLGIDAPRVAEASNVLLPRARAVVSLRLAPGDDVAKAQRALTEHLEAGVPWGAQVTVTPGHGHRGAVQPREHRLGLRRGSPLVRRGVRQRRWSRPASVARSRSSPSSPAPSPAPPCSSPASVTRPAAGTASTRAVDLQCSAARCWRRLCCWPSSQAETTARRLHDAGESGSRPLAHSSGTPHNMSDACARGREMCVSGAGHTRPTPG